MLVLGEPHAQLLVWVLRALGSSNKKNNSSSSSRSRWCLHSSSYQVHSNNSSQCSMLGVM
jgi:hypothetical protein